MSSVLTFEEDSKKLMDRNETLSFMFSVGKQYNSALRGSKQNVQTTKKITRLYLPTWIGGDNGLDPKCSDRKQDAQKTRVQRT